MVWQAFLAAAPYLLQAASSAINASVSRSSSERSLKDEDYLMSRQYDYNQTGAYHDWQRSLATMQQQYDYNLDLMNKSNAFQELMSNTAHQREMADLHAAGLNPILAANSGAYNSFGSSASVSPASVSSSGVSHGSRQPYSSDFDFNGVLQFTNDRKRVNNETKLMKHQAKQMDSIASFNDSNTSLNYLKEQTEIANQLKIQSDIANNNKLTNAQIQHLANSDKSDLISANAQFVNSTTNSARLKHEQRQYEESDAYKQSQWYKKHPTLNQLHHLGNFFGGNNPAQLIKGSIFRIH